MPSAEPIDAILHRLADIKSDLDDLEVEKKELLATLETLRETGQADPKITAYGLSFAWSAGKSTYDYPAEIIKLRAELMELEQLSITIGTATPRPPKPYWSIRNAKEQS